MRKIIVPKPKNRKEHNFCALCNVIDMKAHKAAMLGHIPCLELALKQKPKLFKFHDANGATPIHLAARENQIRAFRWIITNTGKSWFRYILGDLGISVWNDVLWV